MTLYNRLIRPSNTLVVGAAGTGKTWTYVKPSLLDANCSYVVHDPGGFILESVGTYLKKQGYTIRVLNLCDMNHSNRYNPFRYVRKDEDVLEIAQALMGSTTDIRGKNSWPFSHFEVEEYLLLSALMLYLVSEYTPEKRNLTNLAKIMIPADQNQDPLDHLDGLFETLKKKAPAHIAVYQYKRYRQCSRSDARAVLISCAVRLAIFRTSQVQKLTGEDDIDLCSIRDRKTAVFCITSWSDPTFGPLASVLFAHVLALATSDKRTMRKKIPLHIILEEAQGLVELPELARKLPYLKKYGVSVSLVMQSLYQLKALYGDTWEDIIKKCDRMLCLGNFEELSNTYVSKMTKGRILPEDLRKMGLDKCLILRKNVWKKGWTAKYVPKQDPRNHAALNHSAYQETADYDRKNAFDVTKEFDTGGKESAWQKGMT